MVDLGGWASESYRIRGPIPDEGEESPESDPKTAD
jgi:endogenous inhibitor of DNA gyrase (YacG/DUF329 family)